MSRIRAVLFDLDDTLVDHRGAADVAFRAWCAGRGVTADDDLVALWFDAERRHVLDWERGIVTLEEQRRRRLREVLARLEHEPPSDGDVDQMFGDYRARYAAAWRCFPDVEDCLATLERSNILIAVLSNGPGPQQRAKLAATGLSDRVVGVFTWDEIGFPKPDGRAFTIPCQRLGLKPDEVLHVGDRYELDVAPARAAGLRAVQIDRRGIRRRDPDAISTLADLSDYLGETD